MQPSRIIRIKRDGGALDAAQLQAFVDGLAGGSWSDSQAAALAMAIVLRGMTTDETVALTAAMTRSGEVLQWTDAGLPGPILDKHSTGGVGDKSSLMIAPIVAACGGIVPMISGRGLGHTGGTLDKLEALPGYRVDVDRPTLLAALRSAGCAIVGASERLAPADRRLYAIRDVTATVESTPLITASILSKKLAAGLQGLVLDVKAGSGAFTPTLAQARELALSLVRTANGAGLPTRALITDMNAVLGRNAGNALEVREAIAFLKNEPGCERQRSITLALCAELLHLGGLDASRDAARARTEQALRSGAAAERFARMVAALGGPRDILRDAGLPVAPLQRAVPASRGGYVTAIDVRALGETIVDLGGGRRRPGDAVDPRVGLAQVLAPGDAVAAGEPLAIVHAADERTAVQAAAAVQRAFALGDHAPEPVDPVIETLGGETAAARQ